LKRAIRNKEVSIEDATEQLGYFMLEDNGHNNKANQNQWVSDIVMK
jgi:hypothetical protein